MGAGSSGGTITGTGSFFGKSAGGSMTGAATNGATSLGGGTTAGASALTVRISVIGFVLSALSVKTGSGALTWTSGTDGAPNTLFASGWMFVSPPASVVGAPASAFADRRLAGISIGDWCAAGSGG